MGATERIVQFIDYKGISKYKFCKDLGFSNKFLDNSSNMGTDNACKILHYFPEINPEWLITGKGEMLKSPSTIITEKIYALNDQERKLQEVSLKKYQTQIELLTETNSILKEFLEELKLKIKTLESEIEQLKKVSTGDKSKNYQSERILVEILLQNLSN